MRTLREPVEKYYIRVNTLKISRDRLIENLRKEGLKPKRSPYLEEGIYFEREGPNFSDDYNPNLPKVVANKFASESPKGLLVGIGIARMNAKEMIISTRGVAVEVTMPKFKLPSLNELKSYEKGYFYAQSLPSMVASHVLDPKEEDLIIDMAAAPGGKTSHIAQLLENRGEVLALDKSKNRLSKMKNELERLGVKNVKLIQMDSRNLPELGIQADKILLDAPCTA